MGREDLPLAGRHVGCVICVPVTTRSAQGTRLVPVTLVLQLMSEDLITCLFLLLSC